MRDNSFSNGKKVLVTGVNGQLGYDTVQELCRRGYDAVGSGSKQKYSGIGSDNIRSYISLDITDKYAVRETISVLAPYAVVHCAAWTAVDAAEDTENIEKVKSINIEGTKNIAEVCLETGAKMIYISTDYVFSGRGAEPWRADSEDFEPLNVYGRSKLEGEFAVRDILTKFFIVRTAWVFGINGRNFVKTILDICKDHDMIHVVNDQTGTPTYTADLAVLLTDMIESERYGIYHASNEGGYISWYGFACEICRQAGLNTKIIPVSTDEYGMSKAARPFNSRLDRSGLAENGFNPLPNWRDSLGRYLKELERIEQ